MDCIQKESICNSKLCNGIIKPIGICNIEKCYIKYFAFISKSDDLIYQCKTCNILHHICPWCHKFFTLKKVKGYMKQLDNFHHHIKYTCSKIPLQYKNHCHEISKYHVQQQNKKQKITSLME